MLRVTHPGDSSLGAFKREVLGPAQLSVGKSPMGEADTGELSALEPCKRLSSALGTMWKYRFIKTGGLFQWCQNSMALKNMNF